MSVLTPILNTDLDKIVMLPLDEPAVVTSKAVRFDETYQAFTIGDNDYKALGECFEVQSIKDEDTKAFILDKFKNNNWSGLSVLSDDAYEIIYSLLPTSMGAKQILLSLYTLLIDWNEDSAEEVLEELGVEYAHLDSQEQEELACELLLNSDRPHTEQTEVNGETRFLYSGELD
jgi:hypothetical protein